MRRNGKSGMILGITVLFAMALFIISMALGEQTLWDCPECGRTGNSGNYCGGCAHPAPWLESGGTENTNATNLDKADNADPSPEPTPTSTPAPYKLWLEWNANRIGWDVYLNDRLLPTDPEALKDQLSECVDFSESTTDDGKRYWAGHVYRTGTLYYGSLNTDLFDFAEVGESSYLFLSFDYSVTNEKKAVKEALKRFHDVFREHFICVNVWSDSAWKYIATYNPNNPDDIEQMLKNEERFILIYTYQGKGGDDYWAKQVHIGYRKGDNYDRLTFEIDY